MQSNRKKVFAAQPLLDQQLCFALYSTSLAMTRVYRPLLQPLGLTYPQYIVLMSLWAEDGLSVSTLGERVALDSGTLTPLLKRMEQAGWIHRRRGEDDERRVFIHLSAEGRALKRRAPRILEQVAGATDCSRDTLESLTASLHRLRQSLLRQADDVPTPR